MSAVGKNIKQMNLVHQKQSKSPVSSISAVPAPSSGRENMGKPVSERKESATATANILFQTAKTQLEMSSNLKISIKETVLNSLTGLYEIVLSQAETEQTLRLQIEKLISQKDTEIKNLYEAHANRIIELIEKIKDIDVKGTIEETLFEIKDIKKIVACDVLHKLDDVLEKTTESNVPNINMENVITEIKELRQANKELGKQMVTIATPTYAEILSKTPTDLQRPKHSIIISSVEEKDTSEEILGKIRTVLDARNTGLQVEKIRKVRNQKVVLSCGSREDLSKMESRLKRDQGLKVDEAMVKDPLVIIRNLLSYNSEDDIITSLKNQNKDLWVGMAAESFKVSERYRRRARNPHECHVILQVTPQMWQRLIAAKQVHIDLQHPLVEDQSPLLQCTRCLGFGHGRRTCKESEETVTCSHCGGSHLRSKCPAYNAGETPKCTNCVAAKMHNTEHDAFSTYCPVRQKWDKIARASISYC